MNGVCVSESQFTDDLALYAANCAAFESAGRQFVQVGAHFCLTVSSSKTKGLAMGSVPSDDIVSSVEVESRVVKISLIWGPLNLSTDGKTAGEVDCQGI